MTKFLVFIAAIILLANCKNNPVVVKTGKEGQALPNVNLLLMDSSTQLNTGNIPTGKPIVIFLFSPYCAYCQAQTKQIINNQEALSKVYFYMVSTFPFNTIKQYYNAFHLENYSNIIVAQDKHGIFEKYLKPSGFPYQAIYSSDKRLRHAYLGIVHLEDLRNSVFE
jgi:hypothetical protein